MSECENGIVHPETGETYCSETGCLCVSSICMNKVLKEEEEDIDMEGGDE